MGEDGGEHSVAIPWSMRNSCGDWALCVNAFVARICRSRSENKKASHHDWVHCLKSKFERSGEKGPGHFVDECCYASLWPRLHTEMKNIAVMIKLKLCPSMRIRTSWEEMVIWQCPITTNLVAHEYIWISYKHKTSNYTYTKHYITWYIRHATHVLQTECTIHPIIGPFLYIELDISCMKLPFNWTLFYS